jgi:para-nitrobenzyl esterase
MNARLAEVTVDTRSGRCRGLARDGVARFMGIPYAAAPIGPLRLRGTQPAAAWTGERDCTRSAPASLQTLGGNQLWMNEPIDNQSEDCLYLNVWSPGLRARAPVMVWLHGGQTRNGHGAAPGIDGTALARQGIVVVTINYRLGALGGLAHPALQDEASGTCANWGLQDKLAALRWVHDHIDAFGGDPGRVTLAGQSSGGANAALIAQHRLAEGCYARVIAQSPPLFRPPMFVDLDAAAEYTEAFATSLGVTVPGLRDIDGRDLQRAEHAFAYGAETTARMGRPRTAPVRDGRLLRQWTYDAPAPGLPLLAGWTRTEADFWFALRDGQGCVISPMQAPQTDAELAKRVQGLIGLHYRFDPTPGAAEVIEAYRDGDGTAPSEAWRAIYTDLVFRAPVMHLLARNALTQAPSFAYEFAHPIDSADGGSPHATDVPFVFGTCAHAHFAGKIGDPVAAAATSAAMQEAWLAFVRGEDMTSLRVPWPRWHDGNRPVMRFAGAGRCEVLSPSPLRAPACWPAYTGHAQSAQ